MSRRTGIILLVSVLIAGAVMSFFTEQFAFQSNGQFGFPLDDAWIHLQFARNLHDYGSFSYFKNEIVTSGSTSPLYTFLLAVGFFVTRNEMLLSYFFGILFFLLGGMFLFRVILPIVDNYFIACGAVLLFLLEARLQWIALSGMETTLFIFILLATWYYYREKNAVVTGVGCGLLVWTRPEGVLFVFTLVLDFLYHRYIFAHEKKKKRGRDPKTPAIWFKPGIVILVSLVVLYTGFNLWLSGTFFPNTMAAKIKYYKVNIYNFPQLAYHFFSDNHLQFLWLFAAMGIIACIVTLAKRKPSPELIPLIFSLGVFVAYWEALPVLYQEGRYVMPILPFFIVLGTYGIRLFGVGLKKAVPWIKNPQAVVILILAVFLVQFSYSAWSNRTNYADYCKYINDRQVVAGHWIHDHLPETAVIATHDVGAIAYYSGHRIVDMVGLISPDMISNIGSLDKLRSFLTRKKVTHLAVLRNWFEIDNQPLLFHTDESHPEVLDIMRFDPARTHFVPQNATRERDAAQYYLTNGDYQQAGVILQQALTDDPQSFRTHYEMGKTLLALRRNDDAEKELRNSLMLFPGSTGAMTAMAELSLRRNKPSEAIAELEQVRKNDPDDAESCRLLATIYGDFHIDSTKSKELFTWYKELQKRKSE